MRDFLTLVAVALLTLVILVFVFNPDLLQNIWLWLLGFLGPITAIGKKALEKVKDQSLEKAQHLGYQPQGNSGYGGIPVHTSSVPSTSAVEAVHQVNHQVHQENHTLKTKISSLEQELKDVSPTFSGDDNFNGLTITVLRYMDDGETTLGLLFLEDKFFCYTLEDTFRLQKVKKETRIPSGTYKVDFNKHDTSLTLKYRKTRPWFKYHLHINDVPNFSGVYIHSGSNHTHTEGCLLVASSIDAGNATLSVYHSRETYKKLYLHLKEVLDSGTAVRIKLFDENWLQEVKIKNRQPSVRMS